MQPRDYDAWFESHKATINALCRQHNPDRQAIARLALQGGYTEAMEQNCWAGPTNPDYEKWWAGICTASKREVLTALPPPVEPIYNAGFRLALKHPRKHDEDAHNANEYPTPPTDYT